MYYPVRSFISGFYFARKGRLLTTLFSFVVLSACSSNYTVEQSFPRPLVAPLAVAVDLNLTEEFKTYIYEEGRESRKKISVDLGSAQATLFATMCQHMFTATDKNAPRLTITPSIEDFQYAIPRETRSEIYEVRLKYRIRVADSEANPIADWLIIGYGKTPTAFLKSQQQAMDAAAGIALRDIGSQLSIGFARQPDIQTWLADRQKGL